MAASISSRRPEPTLEDMPTEVITMIMEASNVHLRDKNYSPDEGYITIRTLKPILATNDIFSVRLTSRQLDFKSLDAFGKRFFAVRTHMLSRTSVQCLREISASPRLSGYVKDLVITPLRISQDLDQDKEEGWSDELKLLTYRDMSVYDDDSDEDEDEDDETEDEENMEQEEYDDVKRQEAQKKKIQMEKEEWSRLHEPKWCALVQDQAEFDTECVLQIQRALRSLGNLQQVHLAAYPLDKGAWTDTWGARTLACEVGVDELDVGSTSWYGVCQVLEDDTYRFRDKGLPGHLETMLEALEGIKDEKNWSLKIVFDPPEWPYRRDPNHMNSDLWSRFRGRVQSLEFIRTWSDGPLLEENEGWLVNLLRSCKQVTKVAFRHVHFSYYFFSVIRKHVLRHLILEECYVPNNALALLLDDHSTTLAHIEIRGVRLLPYKELACKQGKPHSTWIGMLEAISKMPGLKFVQLRMLRQAFLIGGESYVQPHDLHRSISQEKGVNNMAAFSGEVATKLHRAIDQSYNTQVHNIFRFDDLRFVELRLPPDL